MDRNKFVVDNIFVLNITPSNNGEFEPQTVESINVKMIGQCGIQIELNSWVKYEIFGPVVHTPKGVRLV